MAKYIDAAAFVGGTLTSSESQLRFRKMTGQEAYFEFLRMAYDAPAADVRPVVHGKWVFKSRWHDSIDENLCSECGQLLTTAAEKQMNFCPNCGARMDGGTE